MVARREGREVRPGADIVGCWMVDLFDTLLLDGTD